jgi:2-dehydro-3-deoxygluconokinase
MAQRTGLLCIGECMMELARRPDGSFGLAYGGDTFNTAAYAARMGMKSAYATALGDDPYSDGIVALAEAENVGTSLIAREPGVMPGLYLIETKSGERTFYYWREHSPARRLFELEGAARKIEEHMRGVAFVYFSGITLSIYSAAGLDTFERLLRGARQGGAKIAFDSNYRPRGWRHEPERARTTFKRFLALCDIALPSLDDERALWGDRDAAATIARLSTLGVPEIVVKSAADGAFVSEGGRVVHLPAPERIAPVDTTAAGDSFNAAYLARRADGASVRDAVGAAHRLAVIVIQHRGAIAPREATDAVAGKVGA